MVETSAPVLNSVTEQVNSNNIIKLQTRIEDLLKINEYIKQTVKETVNMMHDAEKYVPYQQDATKRSYKAEVLRADIYSCNELGILVDASNIIGVRDFLNVEDVINNINNELIQISTLNGHENPEIIEAQLGRDAITPG